MDEISYQGFSHFHVERCGDFDVFPATFYQCDLFTHSFNYRCVISESRSIGLFIGLFQKRGLKELRCLYQFIGIAMYGLADVGGKLLYRINHVDEWDKSSLNLNSLKAAVQHVAMKKGTYSVMNSNYPLIGYGAESVFDGMKARLSAIDQFVG